MYKLASFWKRMKLKEEQYKIVSKKLTLWARHAIFLPHWGGILRDEPKERLRRRLGQATLMKIAVVMETSKKDRDTIDTSKFPKKVNEQLLNVSAPYSQSSYQN